VRPPPTTEQNATRLLAQNVHPGTTLLRERSLNGNGVQRPPVDRQPPIVQGLHLVRQRDVGVQVWVPGAALPVGERGGHQPGEVHLAYAASSFPG
jgi:hypothetical protein